VADAWVPKGTARARTATIRETCPRCGSLFEYSGPAPLGAVADFRRAHKSCAEKERDGGSKRD